MMENIILIGIGLVGIVAISAITIFTIKTMLKLSNTNRIKTK